MSHPIILTAIRDDYYTPLGGFNLFGLLKSPMILMMLFSGIMMFALPKLTVSEVSCLSV
jgi:hypothetical protein